MGKFMREPNYAGPERSRLSSNTPKDQTISEFFQRHSGEVEIMVCRGKTIGMYNVVARAGQGSSLTILTGANKTQAEGMAEIQQGVLAGYASRQAAAPGSFSEPIAP